MHGELIESSRCRKIRTRTCAIDVIDFELHVNIFRALHVVAHVVNGRMASTSEDCNGQIFYCLFINSLQFEARWIIMRR